jgi:hypothetical protein
MNLHGVKGWPELKADYITPNCEPIVKKMWEPLRLTTLLASTACCRDRFTLYLYHFLPNSIFNTIQPFYITDSVAKRTGINNET